MCVCVRADLNHAIYMCGLDSFITHPTEMTKYLATVAVVFTNKGVNYDFHFHWILVTKISDHCP